MTEKERELLEICQNLGLSKDKIYPLMKTLDFSLPLDSLVKNVCNEFQ